MQIINYINVAVFNRSYSALKLASENSEYIPFARKIISAKMTDAYCQLIVSSKNNISYSHAQNKIIKYESFLYMINALEAGSCQDDKLATAILAS